VKISFCVVPGGKLIFFIPERKQEKKNKHGKLSKLDKTKILTLYNLFEICLMKAYFFVSVFAKIVFLL